jgi:hypothetical protein
MWRKDVLGRWRCGEGLLSLLAACAAVLAPLGFRELLGVEGVCSGAAAGGSSLHVLLLHQNTEEIRKRLSKYGSKYGRDYPIDVWLLCMASC